jgi:DNA-binding response OmpR family regulator
MELQRNRGSAAPDFASDLPEPQAGGRPVSLAVVEDDDDYRDSVLVPRLAAAGFAVHGMARALDLYRAMTLRPYDLVLLDAGLPDEDGYSIAAHLRRLSGSIGIVMLTGLGSAQDRLRGLRAGVDAYLHKPTDIETLTATLWNLTRRVSAAQGHVPAMQARRWRMDETNWRLMAPGGGEVEMSLAERQVLSILAAQCGAPVRRETLIEQLVKNVHDFDPHRLEMLVYRLRRKCLQLTGQELPLRAVRGIGYVLVW